MLQGSQGVGGYHCFEISEPDKNSFIKLVLGPGLLYARGDDHRRQRKMLNPMFTANRIRTLTPNIYDVAHKVRYFVQQPLLFH